MIHIIYIYLIINSFILGWHLRDNRYETLAFNIVSSVVIIFFGAIILPLVYIVPIIVKPLGWLIREVKFQYRFRLTNYWDRILLDDNYSQEYKTREEKLERMKTLTDRFSKQVKRHNRLIQKRYGK